MTSVFKCHPCSLFSTPTVLNRVKTEWRFTQGLCGLGCWSRGLSRGGKDRDSGEMVTREGGGRGRFQDSRTGRDLGPCQDGWGESVLGFQGEVDS